MVAHAVAHVDMDAFYAAVEVLDHPELRGKPVIAGGSRDGARGVVCSATYEARRYGVRSAMPAARARQLCPHAVFMPLRFSRYESLSERIHAIFRDYTPVVQPVSIDEAFLDLANRDGFGRAETMAWDIKSRIRDETGGLTASVGLAPSKALAKIGSDLDKPDGFVVIRPGEERDFLAPLAVSRAWGVGPKATEKFERLGIRTFGDLAGIGRDRLESLLGAPGERLWLLSQGVDLSRVKGPEDRDPRKSISAQSAFGEVLDSRDALEERLLELSERVTARARKKSLMGRTVSLKVRFDDFGTATRDRTLAEPTNATETVFRTTAELLRKVASEGRAFTRVGVGLSNLSEAEGLQLELFQPIEGEPGRRVDEALDRVRERFGQEALTRGRLLEAQQRRKRRRGETMPGLDAERDGKR